MAVTASQIASWLKAERTRAGLSQGEAAKKAGVNPDAISKWERGEKGIMAENFVALVIAYDADVRSINAGLDHQKGGREIDLMQRLQDAFHEKKKSRRVAEPGPIYPAAPSTKLAGAKKPSGKKRRRAAGE